MENLTIEQLKQILLTHDGKGINVKTQALEILIGRNMNIPHEKERACAIDQFQARSQ